MFRLLFLAVCICLAAGVFVPRFAEKLATPEHPEKAAPVTATTSSGTNQCTLGEPVTLYASANGHFRTNIELNDRIVDMIIDTGASYLTLSHEEAERLGLDLQHGRQMQVQTANGPSSAILTSAHKLRIGPICLDSVDVLVAPRGALREGLIGMDVIRRLKQFDMSQSRLVMAQ